MSEVPLLPPGLTTFEPFAFETSSLDIAKRTPSPKGGRKHAAPRIPSRCSSNEGECSAVFHPFLQTDPASPPTIQHQQTHAPENRLPREAVNSQNIANTSGIQLDEFHIVDLGRSPPIPPIGLSFHITSPPGYPIRLVHSRSPSPQPEPTTRIPQRASRRGLRKLFLGHSDRNNSLTSGRPFERPQLKRLFVHLGLCLLTWPVLLICNVLARGRTLFWARLVVGAGCGLAGIALGLSLAGMARRILEAAVWATIIHQSKLDGSPGVRLHDLVAHTRDPSSVWPAMRLLWDRHAYPGADRGARRRFDSRPWTLYILLYIFVILYGICLPFLFGRAVEIGIQIEQQLSEHIDIIVTGGLSDADTTRLRGLEPFIRNDTFGWSLETSHHNRFAPFSLPWKDDKVFFSGLDERDLDSAAFKTYQPSSNVQTGEYVGTLVERGSGLMMLPRWGLRTDCALISDTGRNIVPRAESGATYVFVSIRDLHPLFENLDLPFPESTLTPLSYPMDLVLPQDTLTTGWELGSVVLGARFDDDGRSFQMNSTVITPTGLEGFIAISTTLVRINTAFAPAGDFSRYSENISSSESPGTRIGYDAAVCVQAYEVWVLEVHRAPDSRPMAGRIVRRATLVGNLNDSGGVGLTGHGDGGLPGHPGQGLDFNKTIPVLGIAHRNGVNVLRKESSVSGQYVASSLLVSATDADTSTPLGYTRLSPAKYAELKGAFDAANVASHLHGSERVVARWYPDAIRATSGIYYSIFAPIVGVAFFVGAVTAFCIPTLPANAPRRGFDLYSWVAALNARELLGTRMGRIQRQMELEAIEQVLVDSRIRYVG